MSDQMLHWSELVMFGVVVGGVWRWFLPDEMLAWGIGVVAVDFAIKWLFPAWVFVAVLLTIWFTVLCIAIGLNLHAEYRRWVSTGLLDR